MRLRPFALLLGLAAAAATANADTHDVTTVALGWQTETADAVVVASPAGGPGAVVTDGALDVRVDRALKGEPAAGQSIRVAFDAHGRGSPWRAGRAHLLFLRRAGGEPGDPTATYSPLSGEFSVRALEEGSAEARFPSLVADLRAALDAGDPAALRSLLVAWMDDADPGVAWSAATDFVRHTELHGSVPEADAARISAAFRGAPAAKSAKGALALAVAAARAPGAAETLADSLLAPGAERIRGQVAEALRRLADPAASPLLAARLTAATTASARGSLLGALAVNGRADAVPAVRTFLADADPVVRVETAAALGTIARNVRAADPDARLGLAGVLAARLASKDAADDERRALFWSLAQLDEPRAFDALRAAAADDALPAPLREWATRLLARPRQSLVLGG